MTIKTRFAPSPTGYLHIGGVRTALYSWAFAKHHGGEFLLRIEDTDLERSTAESVQIILQGMDWVGLHADNRDHIVYQTQNFPRYKELIAQLLASGHAYYCYCSKEELAAMREKAEREGAPRSRQNPAAHPRRHPTRCPLQKPAGRRNHMARCRKRRNQHPQRRA